MNKDELNVKLGYDNELVEQLANAFDLQEDYNDYGWNKLFEICRYIYNLEIQLKKQKDNWDELKRWLCEDEFLHIEEVSINSPLKRVLNKMQELERGVSDVKD